jgi:predicted amidohydrolase
MGRFLNVGIIQMVVSPDTQKNLYYLEKMVDSLMQKVHKPEIIIGVEGGIGVKEPQQIPGEVTDFLGDIAKKHGIYFVPGTMSEGEAGSDLSTCYNTAPIFGPDGKIIDTYRKMCPWYPEEKFLPGTRYVVIDIPEKQTKLGFLICYDMYFPEIARALTLYGSEVLVKLSLDPDPLYEPYKCLSQARAIENQAYVIATNGVGEHSGGTIYGHSIIVDPESNIIWEAGRTATIATITIDLDKVTTTRNYGAFFMDQTIKHLRYFAPPNPFADGLDDAPIYKKLLPPFNTEEEYSREVKKAGAQTIGRNKS